MPNLMYGSVDANGVRLKYYRTGGEKIPVVLLHGITDAGLSWNWLPVELEPEFDVVAYDARGHGYSDQPASGYGPHEQAADVLALISALRLDHPVLLGHSMGAVVAAAAAAQAPKAVRGLILEEPPWYNATSSPEQRAGRAAKLSAWLEELHGQDIEQLEERCLIENPTWHESEAFQWAKSKQRAAPQVSQFITEPWPSLEETLSKLRLPGLLIAGETALGSVVSEEIAHKATALWKGLQVVRLPGAGHNVHREQYRPYALDVKRFLRRLR